MAGEKHDKVLFMLHLAFTINWYILLTFRLFGWSIELENTSSMVWS